MDVATTAKVNDMIKNLTKHGIIFESEEAIQMARKMYHVEKEDSSVAKQVTITEKESKTVEHVKDELKGLVDRRLQYFLEKQNNAILKELQELWTRINQLEPEFEGKLSQIRQDFIVSGNLTQSDETANEPDNVLEPENPRKGGYIENDVSVDKIFYFGQK